MRLALSFSHRRCKTTLALQYYEPISSRTTLREVFTASGVPPQQGEIQGELEEEAAVRG